MTEQQTWITVGQRSDLIDGAGVGAQVDSDQVALFYLKKHNQLFAVGNLCPFNDLKIISRGIIGDIKANLSSPAHCIKSTFRYAMAIALSNPKCVYRYGRFA